MSNRESMKKKKKNIAEESQELPWRQKKALADTEEEVVREEEEELRTWTTLFESMDDQQLKEYVLNRPDNLKTVKIAKGAPSKRVQRVAKTKHSTSHGLMAAIWKFHSEEDET